MSFLGDLWGSFTGEAQQKDLARGRRNQRNELMTGYDEASGQLTEGYNTARGYVDPYAASGRQNQQMYDDLQGLNGPDARARAQEIITSDPLWQGKLAQDQNASLRLLNSRGLSGSGANALASARVLNENYQPVLNRYQQGGAQGLQAAGMGADLASRYGSERSNLTYGNAQQLAGVEGNYANAMAASRGTLFNNILNTAATVMTGFNPGVGGQTAYGNMGKAMSGGNALWGAGAQANPAAASSYTMPSNWGGVGAYPY